MIAHLRRRPRKKGFASRGLSVLYYPDGVFYVYVLRSESDSGFYIGFSTDLEEAVVGAYAKALRPPTKSRGSMEVDLL